MSWTNPVILFALLFSNCSFAATAQGKENIPPDFVNKLKDDDFQVLGVEIGQSRLSELLERFDTQKSFAGKQSDNLCLSNRANGTIVKFESAGKSNDFVLSFTINTTKNRDNMNCAIILKSDSLAVTKSQLKLGLSRKAVLKRFGKPTSESKDRIEYYFSGPRTLKVSAGDTSPLAGKNPSEDVYDVVYQLEFKFRDGRVESMKILRQEIL